MRHGLRRASPGAGSRSFVPPRARPGDKLPPMESTINIRNISVKCGNCDTYQTLASFARREEWNVYTYECENDRCDPAVTRTLIEVPQDLDEFANRDPDWRGGKKWGGAE
jgi:hypothetical protein